MTEGLLVRFHQGGMQYADNKGQLFAIFQYGTADVR